VRSFVNRILLLGKALAKRMLIPVLNRRFTKGIASFSSPYKLHLGCGYHRLTGWVNIDFIDTPAVDLKWNLSLPIPLGDSSCSFIFHEHVLEHFELERGEELLQECYRLLKQGGVLRIAMPCLKKTVDEYLTGDWQEAIENTRHMPAVRSGAEYMNVIFRHWGHKWIYDETELKRVLEGVGFDSFSVSQMGQSVHAELQGLECRTDSHLIIEATKTNVA
jgi:predicted SAM-dependent methyltransferase